MKTALASGRLVQTGAHFALLLTLNVYVRTTVRTTRRGLYAPFKRQSFFYSTNSPRFRNRIQVAIHWLPKADPEVSNIAPEIKTQFAHPFLNLDVDSKELARPDQNPHRYQHNAAQSNDQVVVPLDDSKS